MGGKDYVDCILCCSMLEDQIMDENNYTRVCLWCGREFEPDSEDQICCTNECEIAYFQY